MYSTLVRIKLWADPWRSAISTAVPHQHRVHRVSLSPSPISLLFNCSSASPPPCCWLRADSDVRASYFSRLILNNVSLSGLFVAQGFGGEATLGFGWGRRHCRAIMSSRFVNAFPHLFKHASYTHLQHEDRYFTLLNVQFAFTVWFCLKLWGCVYV